MLELTTLSGESHFLANQIGLSRKQAVNGNRSLSFLLPKTDVNAHAFSLVEEECFITDQSTGHRYRIKQLEQRVAGQTPVKSVTAMHEFFDLIDVYKYNTLSNGVKTISVIMDFIFANTGWTYNIVEAFDNLEFENFGDDNCIALFNKALQRYRCEFELRSDKHVTIRRLIGIDADLQFRYNHNVKTFKHTIDTSNLSTYIRGEGKPNDKGVPVVTAEYTSPNAAIFGIRHAKPYSNETIIHQPTLLASLKRQLIDAPEVSIELEFSVLKDAGYLSEKPGLGDRVPTIYEPLGIDLDLRVMEIEDYPGTNQAPKVTLSTLRKSYGSALTDFTKGLFDEFFDAESGKLKYDVLDEATRRATEALNNSLTELQYPPGMGIVAQDPNNPLRFVAFRSSGLGVTTDGGVTFPNAITADGINTNLLTAGQINTNRIRIFGGSTTDYSMIEGSYFESRGRYSRTWRGETKTHDIRLKFENGYLRARNDNEDRSAYFTDFGISTQVDGVNASGTLEFFSKVNSPIGRGVTLTSEGVTTIEANGGAVYIQPSTTLNVSKPIYTPSAITTSFHGYFGVDGELRAVNKGYLDPTLPGNSIIWRDMRASGYFGDQLIVNQGTNLYLGVENSGSSSEGEVRVTNKNGHNGGAIGYRPIRASEYRNGSSVLTKQNIEPMDDSGLDVVNNLELKRYVLNEDVDAGNYSNWQIGVLSELSPEVATQDGAAINMYKLLSYTVKAVQELSAQCDRLERDNEDLRLIIAGGETQ